MKGGAISTMGFDMDLWQNKLLIAKGLLLWHNLLHCTMLTEKFSLQQHAHLCVGVHALKLALHQSQWIQGNLVLLQALAVACLQQ